jgi:hypothetical protein
VKAKQSLAALKKGKWYYRVETAPGFFTDGRPHENLGIVRALLRDVDFQGLRCLDVGTQEGVIPCLMKQAGAGDVTATDWIDKTDQIKKVQSAYNVTFEYLPEISLPELASSSEVAYDVVNFSGVLYHTLNPLGSLAMVRGLCRLGGLMLVETRTLYRKDLSLVLNPPGHQPRPGSYFYFTVSGLDHSLRLLGLRPLAFAYFGELAEGKQQRVAVLCASENIADAAIDADNKKWVKQERLVRDLIREAGMDFDRITGGSPVLAEPEIRSGGTSLSGRGLHEAIAKAPPYRVRPEEKILRLGATF